MVLVVQTINSAEAQRGGRVALGGQRGGGLAERPPHGGGGDGAQGAPGARQLGVHGGQVGAAVQAREVGRGAGVALAVGRGLAVGHGVAPRALHAVGRGHGQGVRQRGDGGRAPDGHGGAGRAGAGRDGGARGRGLGAVGPVAHVDRGIVVEVARRGRLLLGRPRFGLAGALLLLLAALGPAVLEPDLEGPGGAEFSMFPPSNAASTLSLRTVFGSYPSKVST